MEAIIVAIIGAATTISGTVLGIVSARHKKQCAEDEALRNGLQSLLRAEIIRTYEKNTDREYCPIYAKEALKIEYSAYHNLGGNDVATELYKATLALPTEPPEEHHRRSTGVKEQQ